MSKATRKLRREAACAQSSRVKELAIFAVGAGLLAPFAMGQEQDANDNATTTKSQEEMTEILVTGIRKALQTSQEIKREADTVVDSITATDIGAFPDKSVAEALQRMTGVTVTRFAASGDTSHFSAEPSGVVVRGLPQVRSEFNGRDSFNANSSRGLSFGDVTPELMAGVEDERATLSGGHGGHAMPNPTAGRSREETLKAGFVRFEQDVGRRLGWYAGIGHTERMPDYWELFSADMGPMGAVNAFSGLDTEKTTQLDVGLQYRGERVSAWVAAYAGRVDDMVKVRGATVYPAEVEAGLRSLDSVRQAFVTDVPGPDGRPAVGAAVVPVADASVEEVAAAARGVLSAFKVPTTWVALASADEVPMLASGKVDKGGLQRLIESRGAPAG